MTVAFGRRRLILSLTSAPRKSIEIPEAIDATDKELRQLTNQAAAEKHRLQWESKAILLGGMRTR